MKNKEILLKDIQSQIDSVYGENQWKVTEYTKYHEPCTVIHSCGEEKVVSRYSTLKSGKSRCKCQYKDFGRKWTFEALNDKINEITHGTYELVELKDSTEFYVNHKNCDRPPFKTSSMRFFTRGQRCACCKKGRSGRKSNKQNEIELNNLIKENDNAAN